MKATPLQLGDVLIVSFPQHVPTGHEQEGRRPAIVVGLPTRLGAPRYPMVLVVPLTTAKGKWVTENPQLYPTLPVGAGGLNQPSTALLDHVRGVDLQRIVKRVGALSKQEYALIEQGLVGMIRRS